MVTYGQKSEDVNNKHDILKHRHSSSTVDVAKVHDERNRPYLVLSVIDNVITVINLRAYHQCALPIGSFVRFLVHVNQRLDHRSNEKGSARSAGLPRHRGHPSSEVRKKFLILGRCKLRNPVILSSRCGSHRSHLGQAQDHKCHAGICPDIAPEEAGNTSSDEPLCGSNQQDLANDQHRASIKDVSRTLDIPPSCESSVNCVVKSIREPNPYLPCKITVKANAESARKSLLNSCCLPILRISDRSFFVKPLSPFREPRR